MQFSPETLFSLYSYFIFISLLFLLCFYIFIYIICILFLLDFHIFVISTLSLLCSYILYYVYFTFTLVNFIFIIPIGFSLVQFHFLSLPRSNNKEWSEFSRTEIVRTLITLVALIVFLESSKGEPTFHLVLAFLPLQLCVFASDTLWKPTFSKSRRFSFRRTDITKVFKKICDQNCSVLTRKTGQ